MDAHYVGGEVKVKAHYVGNQLFDKEVVGIQPWFTGALIQSAALKFWHLLLRIFFFRIVFKLFGVFLFYFRDFLSSWRRHGVFQPAVLRM